MGLGSVPWGGSLRRHHQEWSSRLNTGKLTRFRHSKSCQVDNSFLIPRVVLRGHSQLVESSPVRIVRLIALSHSLVVRGRSSFVESLVWLFPFSV